MERNEPESIRNLGVFGIIIMICAFVLYSASMNVGNKRLINETFSDPTEKLSFEYPSDFKVQPLSSIGLSIYDIYPKYMEGYFDPNVIEITIANDTTEQVDYNQSIESLKKLVGERKSLKYNSDVPAIQAIDGTSGERTISTYFKANGKIYVFRLNQFYYNNSNPILLNNNTVYTSVYYKIINSASFK